MNHGRAGFALLEVMIAMAILATTGLSLVHVVRQATVNQHETDRAERVMRDANRVLTALTLLKADEFDQSIGAHPLGEFIVEVQRPEPGLYRIAIAEARAHDRELLVTVVHRGIARAETR